MGKQIQGVCRLCLRETFLVDSHIIPKFQYKQLKAEDGSFLTLTADPNISEKKMQKGITEYLLCSDCDGVKISRYEDHLAEVMTKKLLGKIFPTHVEISGYDYKKVKNALLSILWRMSITVRPMFQQVDLGPKHGEIIRDALLNDLEFDEQTYPITVTIPYFDGKFMSDFIMVPHIINTGYYHVYNCVLCGLLFGLFIGSEPIDSRLNDLILKRDSWKMLRVDGKNIPFLTYNLTKMGQAMYERERRD